MITLICHECGKSYEHKRSISRFCSKECFEKDRYKISLTEIEKQVILTGVFGDG